MHPSLRYASLLLVAAAGCGTPVLRDPDAGDTDAGPADGPGCAIGLDDTITGRLAVSADDRVRVWVNGVLLDRAGYVWNDPHAYDVAILRHPSRTNVIAVEATNLASGNGYDRGVLLDLRYDQDGPQRIGTDGSWRVTGTPWSGWETESFDDNTWLPAFVIGPAATPPWGDVLAGIAPGSTASWIWKNDPGGLATTKPDLDVTYTRYTFAGVDPSCAL